MSAEAAVHPTIDTFGEAVIARDFAFCCAKCRNQHAAPFRRTSDGRLGESLSNFARIERRASDTGFRATSAAITDLTMRGPLIAHCG